MYFPHFFDGLGLLSWSVHYVYTKCSLRSRNNVVNVMAGGLRCLGKLRLTGKILFAEDLIRNDPEKYEDDERAARKKAEVLWYTGLSGEERDKWEYREKNACSNDLLYKAIISLSVSPIFKQQFLDASMQMNWQLALRNNNFLYTSL